MSTPKTFTEHEVAEVIGRAVERQRAAEREAEERAAAPGAAPDAPEERVGLTLDELEQVGRAAGIDPAHLLAAADEVAAAGAPAPEGAFVERWVDAPLTDAGWEDAVAALRAAPAPFGLPYDDEQPSVERVGRSYEWTRTEETIGTTRVNVSPRGDRTRVRVWGSNASAVSDPVSGALGTAAVASVLTWVAILALDLADVADGTAIAAAVGVVLGAVAFFALRGSEPEARRDEAARVRGIADAVAAAVAGGAEFHAAEAEGASLEERPAEPAAAEPAGWLDLDAVGEAPRADRVGPVQRERA